MGPIEIGKAIDTYGIAIVTGILLALVCYLVRLLVMHFIKQQDDNNLYYRGLVTGEFNKLHKDSVKNTRLTKRSITLVKEVNESIKKQDDHAEKFSEKIVESLKIICNKMNDGGLIKGIIDRRSKDIKVKEDRRK